MAEENKEEFQNTLYTNDNLFVLRRLDSESVDLIYLDPPFNSKRMYENPIGTGSKKVMASFKDIWTWEEDVDEAYLAELGKTHPDLVKYIFSIGQLHSEAMMSYITYMTQRVLEMHRILKPTGSLYYHCDPTAGHFVKLMLDGIFGRKNFQNEIIWCYSGPSNAKSIRKFPSKHDIIYFYRKTNEVFFNKDDIRIPYKELHTDKGSEKSKIWKNKGVLQDEEKRQEYLENGRIPFDWWNDIPSGGHISPKERVGYPTQKPLKLLDRIINASCPQDGIVLDPFCGCATTCVSAEHLGRKWIGIDISEVSANIVVDRLKDAQGRLFEGFIHRRDLPNRHDLKIENLDNNLTKKEIKKRLYEQQKGCCNGCLEHFDIKNLEIDHIFPKAKGGEDNYENFQLLCGYCNRVKGSRPMEYLKRVLDANKDILTYKLTYGNQDFHTDDEQE